MCSQEIYFPFHPLFLLLRFSAELLQRQGFGCSLALWAGSLGAGHNLSLITACSGHSPVFPAVCPPCRGACGTLSVPWGRGPRALGPWIPLDPVSALLPAVSSHRCPSKTVSPRLRGGDRNRAYFTGLLPGLGEVLPLNPLPIGKSVPDMCVCVRAYVCSHLNPAAGKLFYVCS